MAPHWEHFSHAADMGVRGCGATQAAAFEQAALALTAIVVDPAVVAQRERVDITCDGDDAELLLVDWLNALVFEMATRNLLFSRFQIDIDAGHLRAAAWGEPVDRQRHHPVVEVKGATYTALRVTRRDDGSWMAQCVVDV
ncbi:archease [Microbulbifer sp. SAOS-129_SWC]|uniref:archease n=1 Tax=Microbulbifer sp. SAOS-129_SWC TaxID=3145235 RepID=UPI00321723E2